VLVLTCTGEVAGAADIVDSIDFGRSRRVSPSDFLNAAAGGMNKVSSEMAIDTGS
jgi:hypothetical protein